MNLAAVMMVRNEQCILPISVGHLLHGIGVDRLIIADNGSTDSTVPILRRISQIDVRVQWTDASGPYNQAETVTELAREAHRKGATWVIASDADEFCWVKNRNLRDVLSSTTAGALVLDVRNFIQWSWVREDHFRTLEKMVFSAHPVGEVANAKQLVESKEIAWLQAKCSRKFIVRSSSSLLIHKGNHNVDGVGGDFVEMPDAKVLHAPLRARDRLLARIEAGKRVEATGVTGDTSWHLRRLLLPAQINNLEDEWRANSTQLGLLGPPRRKSRLRLDMRLRRIARQQRAFQASCIPEPSAPVRY